MIRIYTDNRYSIKIGFDEQGAKRLIQELKISLSNEVGILEGTDSTSGRVLKMTFKRNDVSNNIQLSQSSLDIELDSDEIEYAIIRFTESIMQKAFFPAELCEGIVNKKNVTLYAEYSEQ